MVKKTTGREQRLKGLKQALQLESVVVYKYITCGLMNDLLGDLAQQLPQVTTIIPNHVWVMPPGFFLSVS